MKWKGVMPAVTTCFTKTLEADAESTASHCRWMLENGCIGIIALGSLGEGATLSFEEKKQILKAVVNSVGGYSPVVAAISALSTVESIRMAQAAAEIGCSGLMILPPYVYQGDWREMRAYVGDVIGATNLSCMLYNNPIAYGTDFLPEQIEELAGEFGNLEAVKESSADVRRVSAIRALLGQRLEIFVGVDDAILEALPVGATGWVAGLANAFPR